MIDGIRFRMVGLAGLREPYRRGLEATRLSYSLQASQDLDRVGDVQYTVQEAAIAERVGPIAAAKSA